MPFDLNQYLAARQQFNSDPKRTQIQEARDQKLMDIVEASNGKQQALAAQAPKPWVDSLDLRYTSLGSAVNLAASVYSGAGRVAGDILSLAPDAAASVAENSVTPEEFKAYNRMVAGKPLEGDTEALSSTIDGFTSALARIQKSKELRGTAADIDKAFDLTSVIDKRGRDQLNKQIEGGFAVPWEQIAKGWDSLNGEDKLAGAGNITAGVAKLIYHAGDAALTNPQASAEYIAENVPQLAIGMAGKVGKAALSASNLGYGAENYRKGLENYAKANNGAYPSEEVRQEMTLAAAGTVLAEQAGDMFSLSAMKSVAKGVEKVGEELSRKGFKNAMLGIAGATGKGTASEALTEGVQTYLEGEAQLKPASASDIYVGATIGGIAGGGLTGGGRALAAGFSGATGAAVESVAKAEQRQATEAAVKLAVEAGDPAVFLDPKSAMYAPDKAVAVLREAGLKKSNTPEQAAEKYQQASNVVLDLNSQEDALFYKTTKGRAKAAQELSGLSSTDTSPEVKAERARLEAVIAAPALTEEERKDVQTQRTALAKQIDSAYKTLGAFEADMLKKSTAATPEVDSVKVLQAEASAAVNPTDTVAVGKSQSAATKIINMSMTAPGSIDSKMAAELANNLNNGLSQVQRATLRQVSAAQVAINQMKDGNKVRQEIYYGDAATNQVGIATYMKRLGLAVTAGNTGLAVRQIKGISSFISSHEGKSAAVAEAMGNVKSAQDPEVRHRGFAVLRTDDGRWIVKPIPVTADMAKVKKGITDNGGLRIHQGSGDVMKKITEEVSALKQTKAVMEAVIALGKPKVAVPAPPVAASAPAASTPVPVNSPTPAAVTAPAAPVTPAAAVAPVAPVAAATPTEQVLVQPTAQVTTEQVALAEAAQQPKVEQPQAAQTAAVAEAAPARKKPKSRAKKEKLPETLLQQIMRAEKEIKRVTQRNPSSLWSALKHKLSAEQLSDIHSSDWKKKFTFLKARNGQPGLALDQLIEDGALDEFLPYTMRFSDGVAEYATKYEDARDHIVEALRDRNYLTFETQLALRQIGDSISDLEAMLTNEEIENEFQRAQEEASQQDGASEQVSDTATEATDGNPAGNDATQGEGSPEVEEAALAVAPKRSGAVWTALEVAEEKAKLVGKKLANVYRQLNPVRAFLVQKSSRGADGSKRPLAATFNFLSAWNEDGDAPYKHFSKEMLAWLDRPVDGLDSLETVKRESQNRALNDVFGMLNEWVPLLRKNIPKAEAYASASEDFNHQDMLRHLMVPQADGTMALPENVLTAMAYAMYQFVVDQASAPAVLSAKQISEMHGRKEETRPTFQGETVLRDFHSFEDTLINSLGQAAVQALGYAEGTDASVDLIPRLQGALGTHALALLEQQGFIVRKKFMASEVNANFFPEDLELAAKFRPLAKFTYVQFTRQGKIDKPDVLALIAEIKAANKLSGSVVDKLFGSDKTFKFASNKRVEFTQEFAQDTQQRITDEQREGVQLAQDVPHSPIPEMLQLMLGMGKDAFMTAAGAVDFDATVVHPVNKLSTNAKNASLLSQADLAMEMLGLDFDNWDDILPEQIGLASKMKFYIEQSVWKNFRVGVSTQSLNQQASKIHRFMFSRPNWEATISLADTDMVNVFKISVAQALGVKVDLTPNAITLLDGKVLNIFENKESDFYKAAEVIRQGVLKEDGAAWSEENQALVAEVSANNEGMMTLQGLMALAKYIEATETFGTTDFKVTLLVGADGKTNGPILSQLALGAAGSVSELFTMLNRGGMFSTTDAANHYSEFAADGGRDLYQHLAGAVLADVKENFGEQEVWAAMQVITKQLMNTDTGKIESAGRNLMKPPMTSFAFGSALKKSVQNMRDSFIEGIYSAIEDLANGTRKDLTDPGDLVKAINTMIAFSDSDLAGLPETLTVAQLLDPKVLNWLQISALQATFDEVLGYYVKQVMETQFAVYIERRRALVQAVDAGYQVYDAAMVAARQQLLKKMMDAEDMPFRVEQTTDRRIPLRGLTQLQENALQQSLGDLLPQMHTAFSKRGDDIGAGLFMAKQESALSTKPTHASKVFLATPMRNSVKAEYPSLKSKAMEHVSVEPGLVAAAAPIHSGDASNMFVGMLKFPKAQGLNVHDEVSTGVQHIGESAKAINEATVSTFLNYSPAAEARDMLGRQLVELAKQVQAGTLPASVVRAAYQVMADKYNKYKKNGDKTRVQPGQAGGLMMGLAAVLAYQADTLRLGVFSTMRVMDQYTWEGGQFEVTEEIWNAAAKQLAALSPNVSPEVEEALQVLERAFYAKDVAPGVKPKTMEVGDLPTWEEDGTDAAPVAVSAQQLGVPGVLTPKVITKAGGVPAQVREAVLKGTAIAAAVNALPDDERAVAIQGIATAVEALAPWETSPWGDLGGSDASLQNDDLVTFLAPRAQVSAREMYPVLAQMLGAKSELIPLLKRIVSLAPADFKVVYVTPNTPATAVIEAPHFTNSRGWYVADGKRNHAYILSPAFTHSAVNAEVVLHEMLHAVLNSVIDNPITREAEALVVELEELLAEVRKHPDIANFGNAADNVHELVSWGMTNREFQTTVLAKIQVQRHKNKSNPLLSVNGVVALIKAISTFFFRGADVKVADVSTNALTILVSDVAGLFEAVERQGNQVQGKKNFSQQAPGTQNQAMRYTSEQLFDALGVYPSWQGKVLTTEFQSKLRGLLGNIVTKIHGVDGYFKANQAGTVAMTPHDVWMKATRTGEAPFVSQITSQISVTDQEALVIEQVEATLRAALNDDAQTGAVYKEMRRLYEEARRRLKPADFPSQELYDFVFAVNQDPDKRSDYLTRFAAMGLGHQEVNKALGLTTEIRVAGQAAPKSIADRLTSLVQKLLAWFSGKATKAIAGEAMNTRLAKLSGQLIDIEAKRRLKLAQGNVLERFMEDNEMLENGVKAVRRGVGKVAGYRFKNGKRFGGLNLLGSVVGVALKEHADQVVDKALVMRDMAVKDRQGMIAGLVNSVRGPNVVFQFLLRSLKKLEKERQDVIMDVSKILRESYKDKGAALKSEDKSAISAVFLRTGAHALLGSTTAVPNPEGGASVIRTTGLDMVGIQQLLEDPAAMEAAVKERIKALKGSPHVHYYIYQAKALAYFRASGRQKSALGMMNAGNIARLYGTHLAGKVDAAAADQVEKVIDELTTLYAMQYSEPTDLTRAKEVLRQELGRTDGGNGVEMTLRMHRRLENESKERLFGGQEALQMKGYTSEIYNPNTALAVARDPEEQQALREKGYVAAERLPMDPQDPDKRAAVLFVLKDGGPMPYLTAGMSLTGMAAKGTVRYGGMSNAFDEGEYNNEQSAKLTAMREAQSISMFRAQPYWDPRMEEGTYLTPVLNGQGDVRAWRYLMQEKSKDKYLNRDHRFDQVLGLMAGSIYDKTNSVEHNRDMVKALHELYRRDYSTRPESFIRIAHDSEITEHREMYRLLPDSTQAAIRDIWGPNGMMVPYELLDVVFGYRKLSVSSAFDKKAMLREAERLEYTPRAKDKMNALEEAYVAATEGALYAYAIGVKFMSKEDALTFSRTGGVRMRRGERAVQEIVREIKDTIVVRGMKTMIGNIKSNMSMLVIMGVSPWELAHHSWVAMKGATDYQRDRAELAALRLQLDSGYTRGDEAEIQRKMAVLEDAISRNPVRELIDAGLMPTIVEDVGQDDDLYSYKAAFTKKIDSIASGLNPNVKEVGKWLYMTHDTPIYQSLSRITQLSDFVGRYTLYQHMINRKKNPLDKAQAVQMASDFFVNYDIPMHRGLQYMDDMGITRFTKYFLYIQRVLLKMGKDRPVQMLMSAALSQYLGQTSLVTDSSALYRLGNNPFHTGPFGIVGMPGELATVQGAMALLPTTTSAQ